MFGVFGLVFEGPPAVVGLVWWVGLARLVCAFGLVVRRTIFAFAGGRQMLVSVRIRRRLGWWCGGVHTENLRADAGDLGGHF